MLVMGSGTAWATFSYDWGTSTGIWDFLSGVNISDFTYCGWESGGNGSRAFKTFNNEVGSNQRPLGGQQANEFETWGFNHLKFNGTITIYNYNNETVRGLEVPGGASIGIHVYPGYVVSITASTRTKDNNGNDRGNDVTCTWENVKTTPDSPNFGFTEKTVDVVYNGTSDGYITMTNPGGNYRKLYITKIVMSPKPTLQWVKNNSQLSFDKIDFTKLDYDEPTLEMTYIPSGANVWLTVDSGTDVATVRTQSYNQQNQTMSYDVMALKPGTAVITAHASWNGGSVEASYTVQVDVDEYTWDTEGTYKYFLTGEGAITNPVVDAVPYITMTYGNPNNVGMVRNQNDNLVATVIDQWGWRHARLYDGTNGGALGQPWQGTFYKFEPQIDGDLTIWMRLESGKAVIVEDGNWSTAVKMFESKGGNIAQYETVHLTGGHTYYLYGIVQETYVPENFRQNYGNIWACAELSAFKFEPVGGLIYGYKGLVYKDGKLYNINGEKVYDTAKQPIGGPAETVAYSLEFYPNTTDGPSATIASDGTLTIDETKGGAIAVKAIISKNGQEVNRDYYIVTVPYKTHDWWFTESVNPKELVEDRPAQGKQDFTSWAIAYKVLRPEMKTVTIDGQSQTLRLRKEVKDPVLCSSKAIQGNNAGYAVQTAGLLFDAKAQRFGVNTDMSYVGLKQTDGNGNVITVNNSDGIPIDQYIDNWDTDEGALARDAKINEYAYFKTTTDTYGYPTNLVTMATGSTLIIPDLEEGQYIRIYWSRHNTNKGDKYTATGVTDLEGKDITSEFYIGNGTGYTEFIAKGGNAEFTLNDGDANTSWTNIYRITVGEVGEFLETIFNARVGNIAYNPKPAVPGTMTTGNTVEYVEHTNINVPSGSTFEAWGPIKQFNMPYETFVQDGTGSTNLTIKSAGSTSSLSVSYEAPEGMNVGGGTVTVSGNTLTVSGNGIAAIVCKGKSNGYVLDIDTLTMAYGTVDIQTYPKTWDFTKIGVNTSTITKLQNAYNNGTGINWYKKNTWGDPNTVDETEYKMWEPSGENEYKLNTFHSGIKSTMFAQGSQLTAFYKDDNGDVKSYAIEETMGLGIYLRKNYSGSYMQYGIVSDSGDPSEGLDLLRYGVDNGNGYLQFADYNVDSDNDGVIDRSFIIRVPAVSKTNGERVYICTSGDKAPEVYQDKTYCNNSVKTTLLAVADNDCNANGNTYYFEPAENGDVWIDVTGQTVYKIGVTSTFKKLNNYQGKSYATESREHNVKYDLSGYFTGNDVAAYKVTGYAKTDDPNATIEDDEPANAGIPKVGSLTLEPVEVADANTGLVLVGAAEGFTSEPLFVKDVNSDCDDITTNYMVASSAGVPANAYILTRTYQLLDENGQPTGDKKTGPLAFYKMFDGSLRPNLAYFNMPEESSNYYKFRFIDEMDEEEGFGADEIEQIAIEDLTDSDDAVYYNVSGQKLNGKPTQKGIYICNGKKFYVK